MCACFAEHSCNRHNFYFIYFIKFLEVIGTSMQKIVIRFYKNFFFLSKIRHLVKKMNNCFIYLRFGEKPFEDYVVLRSKLTFFLKDKSNFFGEIFLN